MADDAPGGPWPLPKFQFSVEIAGLGGHLRFQEVTGLERETQVIEYRARGSRRFPVAKMPGLHKAGNVTLKRGIAANDFFTWYQQVTRGAIRPGAITIRLLDEQGKPAMTWTLRNAWPVKFAGADLKSDGNEVAIESLELVHEGIAIANG